MFDNQLTLHVVQTIIQSSRIIVTLIYTLNRKNDTIQIWSI